MSSTQTIISGISATTQNQKLNVELRSKLMKLPSLKRNDGIKINFKGLNYLFMAFVIVLLTACNNDDDDDDDSDPEGVNYKQEMRNFVQGISHYAKNLDSKFIVIPQNGNELLTVDGTINGNLANEYLYAIDGVGREDLFYGYESENKSTPAIETDYMLAYLKICTSNGISVLTTDYCWDHAKMEDSYLKNRDNGLISFSAPVRELNVIPEYPIILNNVNDNDINDLSEVRNFLYLINPELFANKEAFIDAVNETNYDVIIIDLFLSDLEFSSSEINRLKLKENGGKRLVIAYMSIGEAEDYRYYWKDSWRVSSPSWIKGENPDWKGNFKVEYWEKEWQNVIYGNNESYLKKIIDAGFDGVYLDLIDAFEYFEQ